MMQNLRESLNSSLQTAGLGDGTILMWHSAIQRLASEEGFVCINPKECLLIHTLARPDRSAVGQGDVSEGLLRMLGCVSERGNDYGSQTCTSQCCGVGPENSTLKMAHLTVPVSSGNNRGFHEQATGLMPNVLVEGDTLNDVQTTLEPQATVSPEQIHLFLHKKREVQKPARRCPIATSTPLFLSNELDGSEDKFNGSSSLPNAQHTIRSVFKDREKPLRDSGRSGGRSSSMREIHEDIFDALEERLQRKELELRRMARLLLMMHRELEETRKRSDLKDTEIGLLVEKLKLDREKHKEDVAHFGHTCDSLKGKLLTSKADNRTFVRQLRELLEKYEKLKRCASLAKRQSCEDLAHKRQALKTLEEAKREREQSYAERRLLKDQEEAASRAASDLKKKLQSAEEDRERNIEKKRTLEAEVFGMKSEIERLRDHLCKAQNESRRLTEQMLSVELEKEAGDKQLQESRAHIGALKLKLDEYRTDKESTGLQIKEMRHEAKRNHDKLWAETLLVQEDHKACQKAAEGLQKEAAALSKLVLDLKRDKCLLERKLEELRGEKRRFEEKNEREGDRFKGAISSLETERNLLLVELGDLRQDYLNVSDRIMQRMSHVDCEKSHACVNDYASVCENETAGASSRQSKEDDEEEARG